MALPITKEMCAAAYEYSRVCPPFNRLKLPPALLVTFHVTKSVRHFAQYWWDGTRDNIEVSSRAIAYTPLLLEKIQHEMIHLWLRQTKQESKRGKSTTHNVAFRRMARIVCKYHGWDPRGFY